MMRELAPLAAIGLLLIPDGAAGFFGRRRFQAQCAPPVPVYVYPPIVLAPPCLPHFEILPVPFVAPMVTPVTPVAPTPAREPTPLATPKLPRASIAPAKADPVRPVPRSPEVPPLTTSPPQEPVPTRGGFELPELKPATPPLSGLNIPPTSVPGGRPADPTDSTPKTTSDKPAASELTPSNDASGLPALSLPTPGTVTRSSPIRARPDFELIPSAVEVADDPTTRLVEFTNLTGRTRTLRVNGRVAELPDRSAIAAQVGGEFRWSLDDGREVVSRVPEGAAGADIVLRR